MYVSICTYARRMRRFERCGRTTIGGMRLLCSGLQARKRELPLSRWSTLMDLRGVQAGQSGCRQTAIAFDLEVCKCERGGMGGGAEREREKERSGERIYIHVYID